jgi:hypothetical protein
MRLIPTLASLGRTLTDTEFEMVVNESWQGANNIVTTYERTLVRSALGAEETETAAGLSPSRERCFADWKRLRHPTCQKAVQGDPE